MKLTLNLQFWGIGIVGQYLNKGVLINTVKKDLDYLNKGTFKNDVIHSIL